MKSVVSYALCVLAIAVPCVLVAVGNLVCCAAAALIVILSYHHAKEYPHLWRGFYTCTIKHISKFMKLQFINYCYLINYIIYIMGNFVYTIGNVWDLFETLGEARRHMKYVIKNDRLTDLLNHDSHGYFIVRTDQRSCRQRRYPLK